MFELHEASPFSNSITTLVAGEGIVELPDHGVILAGVQLKLASDDGAFVPADLNKIIMRGTNKVIYGGESFTGAMADMVNDYHSLPSSNDYLTLWFADPDAETYEDMLLGCIDLINNPMPLDLKVAWDGTQTGTTVTLTALPIVLSEGLFKTKGTEHLFRAVLHGEQVMGANIHEEFKVPMGSSRHNNWVRGVHVTDTNLGDVEFKHDGSPRFDKRPHADLEHLADHRRTAQAGYFCFDPCLTGINRHAVQRVRNKLAVKNEFKATYSASTTVGIISDLYVQGVSAL